MIACRIEQDDLISGQLSAVILQKIAEGNEAAFRQVYGAFYGKLCQFAFSIVRSRESSEEIVEDVFIRIWQQRTAITAIQNLRVYLYTATKNTALNYLSRKARESATESFDHIHIELSGTSEGPDQLLITSEMYRKIQDAVEGLPPRCKMIFKLIREDGLRYREVAEILNISVNTIDVQMAIAVKRIAAALAPEIGFSLERRPGKK